MPRVIAENNNYIKRLLKIIPSESVAAYLALVNIIPYNTMSEFGILIYNIIIASFITVITPFYLVKVMEMRLKEDITQIIFITLSFLVWVFTIKGEIFLSVINRYEFIKTAVLIIWTTIMPIVNTGKKSE
jgi:hypothetical protein